jgi:hypothetical protein
MSYHKYLTVQLKIWPDSPTSADSIKMLLEDGKTNLLGNSSVLCFGEERLGEVRELRASVWPKPSV